jgi:hypothetical protein
VKLSRAVLDRSHDFVGDVLVNVDAVGLHGGNSARRWAGLPPRAERGGSRWQF